MFTVESSEFVLGSDLLRPILQQDAGITVTLSGLALLVGLMVFGGYIGYLRGIRALLTLTLMSIVAYIICVQSGDQLIGVINRFYTNAPRFLAFVIGRDPAAVQRLDPLISNDIQVPLFFRMVLFVSLVAFAWFFNNRPKWYSAGPNDKAEPLARVLGIFTGGFLALLWSNAAVSFWQEFVATGGRLGRPLDDVLGILPDAGNFIPSLITIFFLLIVVIIVFNLPKLWKP